MLLAQGRNVRASDMQLLDLVCNHFCFFFCFNIINFFHKESMGKSEDNRCYIVRGNWEPLARGFKELTHLNEETPKGISKHFTNYKKENVFF